MSSEEDDSNEPPQIPSHLIDDLYLNDTFVHRPFVDIDATPRFALPLIPTETTAHI